LSDYGVRARPGAEARAGRGRGQVARGHEGPRPRPGQAGGYGAEEEVGVIPLDQEALVADRVRRVNYCYPIVPNRAGQGARILSELTRAGINLLAYSGFPVGGGRSQLDLVLDDMAALRRVARRNGWRLSKVKKGFLIQGTDQ